MPVKELRPYLDPESCSICGRRLLQGEQFNHYVAPDSSRRVVCELCVPRAERVRWVREREGEEIVQLRPTRSERAGFFRRVVDFFGAAEIAEEDDFAGGSARPEPEHGRRDRASRRSGRSAAQEAPAIEIIQRDVAAVPTEPESRLERGLELFNNSQFPRTIAGLSRSLGDPQVAAVNAVEGTAVDIWVGWDLAWYAYRVTLGDPTEPVEQSGRGNDIDELERENLDWNAGADGFGRLFISGSAETSDHSGDENPAP
jgi:hypothetical protein